MTGPHQAVGPVAADGRRRSIRSIVALYAIGGVAAIVILAVASVVLLRRTSTEESVRSAREQTRVMAEGIVEPELSAELLAGSPEGLAAFDQIARTRLLPAGAVRTKLWTGTGIILYSDEPRLIGEQFELEGGKRTVLAEGGSRSGVSDLSEPENRYEQRDRSMLEVYRRVVAPDGTALLFEAYYPYSVVTDSRDRLLELYAPIVVGTLTLLSIVHLALTVSLSRRLRAEQAERERLLRMALRASDDERQRIARDLHDGIVQDLAGVSFTIAGVTDQLGAGVSAENRAALDNAATATRNGIRQLRTLLVDLYPPNLRDAGLEAALADLLARATNDGLHTRLSFDPQVRLAPDDEALAFRVAQEAIRNTLKHAQATTIDLTVSAAAGRVRIEIVDDGRGFDPESATDFGHFGLRFLLDAAAARGAHLERSSAPGQGTRLELTLTPADRSAPVAE
jgi:signal transduction histidine kinase